MVLRIRYMTTKKAIFALILILGLPICLFGGIDQFVGEWKGTGSGLTRIQIRLAGDQVRLRAFGACHPQDCDWGEVNAQPYAANVGAGVLDTAEAVSAQFVSGFSRTFLVAYPVGTYQLRVESFTIFTDTSGRSPYHSTTLLTRIQ